MGTDAHKPIHRARGDEGAIMTKIDRCDRIGVCGEHAYGLACDDDAYEKGERVNVQGVPRTHHRRCPRCVLSRHTHLRRGESNAG
jgi:hypothetical protein